MSTLLPLESKLIQAAARGYRPDREDSYTAGITTRGQQRFKKYTSGSKLITPVFATPDAKLDTKGIINPDNASELVPRIQKAEEMELKTPTKYKSLANIHTHPTVVPNIWLPRKTTDIGNALKPPSSPDLILQGRLSRHPKILNAKNRSNLIFTKEKGRKVVYRYSLPQKDIDKYRRISYQESLNNPVKAFINDYPRALKYTLAELYGGGLGSLAYQGKHIVSNLHRPKKLWDGLDAAGWEGRGKALLQTYKYMGIPVERIELDN